LFLRSAVNHHLTLPIHRQALGKLRADDGNKRRPAAGILDFAPEVTRDPVAVLERFADRLFV
jgi:hypothetical protein